MGKVRLVDIAARVGVSSVTVHNALSGQKGVSDGLREKIVKTAKEMRYRQDVPAKNAHGGKEKFWKIGVIIAENYLAQYSTYYWKMYQELSLIATEKHCYTTIEVLKKDAEKKSRELPQIVKNKSIDGLLIIGEIEKEYIRHLKKDLSVPLVFLDFYDSEIAKDAVIADNFYGMYQMTELLFAQGLREIGFIGSVFATSSIMDRYCGFMKSVMEHRVEVPPEWIVEDRDALGQVGFELPRRLPQAFVCNCDLVAGMLISRLQEQGYRVPEDISVTGFDNFLQPGFADMKITTYEISTKTMAKVALDKVLKQLRNPERGRNLEIISGHIIWKNSVKIR